MHRTLLALLLSTPSLAGDYNGDGYDDLVIGNENGTRVTIVRGGRYGLSTAAELTPATFGISSSDGFGTSLASADLNSDGYDELAIGAPDAMVYGFASAGALLLAPGTATGPTATGATTLTEISAGVGTSYQYEYFSRALSFADLDGDLDPDLVIGIPGETHSGITQGGAIADLPNEAGVLDTTTSTNWNQNTTGVDGTMEYGDWFGQSLAAGDFDGDGSVDIAIGIPGESATTSSQAEGALSVLYGSEDGLTATASQTWSQDSTGIPDSAEAFDAFGQVLDACDLDLDGYDDLIIGVPTEDLGAANSAGVVHILYGSATGLSAAGTELLTASTLGLSTTIGAGAYLGTALRCADYNDDGTPDLAIGAPGATVSGLPEAGAVVIVYGGAAGLTSGTITTFTRATAGVPGDPVAYANFGASLTSGRYNIDNADDLAIGVPDDTVNSIPMAGSVTVLFGRSTGLTTSGSRLLSADTTGFPGVATTGDHFGASLH